MNNEDIAVIWRKKADGIDSLEFLGICSNQRKER